MLATPPSPLKASISSRLTCSAQPQAQTTKINKLFNAGAQCSPRHACPLPGAILMQVHKGLQAAPALVQRGMGNSGFCMQSHAASACMAIFLKRRVFSGRFMRIFCGSARPVGT